MYLAGAGGQIRFAEYDTHRATDAAFVEGLKLLMARGAAVDAVDATRSFNQSIFRGDTTEKETGRLQSVFP